MLDPMPVRGLGHRFVYVFMLLIAAWLLTAAFYSCVGKPQIATLFSSLRSGFDGEKIRIEELTAQSFRVLFCVHNMPFSIRYFIAQDGDSTFVVEHREMPVLAEELITGDNFLRLVEIRPTSLITPNSFSINSYGDRGASDSAGEFPKLYSSLDWTHRILHSQYRWLIVMLSLMLLIDTVWSSVYRFVVIDRLKSGADDSYRTPFFFRQSVKVLCFGLVAVEALIHFCGSGIDFVAWAKFFDGLFLAFAASLLVATVERFAPMEGGTNSSEF